MVELLNQSFEKQTETNNEKLERAIHYATECHQGQMRKGTQIPFITHPLEVMQILLGMGADTNLLIAGLLHDVVEDTETTLEEIRLAFGEDVANLVSGHTEDKTKSWKERKITEMKETSVAPLRLKMLVLADKLANMRSIRNDYYEIGNLLWERFNAGERYQAWYYGEMTDILVDMQNYPKIAPYYWEFVGAYKDVFVVYYYDEKQSAIYQCALAGETYRLIYGSQKWIELQDVIPENLPVVTRKFAETTEDIWYQEYRTCIYKKEYL